MQLSDRILEATNGGLDIILSLYPEAEKGGTKGHFKLRDEKTASASMFKNNSGIYIVKDFGDGKAYNGVSLYEWYHNLEFKEALSQLAKRYNVADENGKKQENKAKYFSQNKEKDDVEGITYEIRELRDSDCKLFGPYVSKNDLLLSNIKAVKQYKVVKGGKVHVFQETPSYPIYVYEYKDFQKIYQPLSEDKGYRFMYIGEKPADYVFGLEEVISTYNHALEVAESANSEGLTAKEKYECKLDYVVIASGDSDAVNFRSLGVNVVWAGSESAKINKLIFNLFKYCKKVINVPDIDSTGVKEGIAKALENINLFTAWIPDEIKKGTDFRGKHKKDFKDYCNHLKNSKFYSKNAAIKKVDKWLSSSINLRFWDEKYNKNGTTYKLNYESCIYFLAANGYGLYQPNEFTCELVKVTDNIVSKIEVKQVREFINNYLRENNHPQDLRNTIYESRFLTEGKLIADLPTLELDFTTAGRDFQYFHFKGVSWLITKEEIKEVKPCDVPYHVWSDDVKPHRPKIQPKIVHYELGELEFPNGKKQKRILTQGYKPNDCLFFKFLHLTSNPFWQTKSLDEAQEKEVENHLLNKFYALGYMLHDYKQLDKALALWIMEEEVIEDGASNGGTGKSLFIQAVKYFLGDRKVKNRNGRDKELVRKWPYDGVTEKTKIYWFDDCEKYIDVKYFYAGITGDVIAEHKSKQIQSFPFEKAGKHVFTSNYGPRGMDGSTLRRFLFVMFSDYFHAENSEKGLKQYSPSDEFGKQLFIDFTDEEHNSYYNTLAQAVQFYLNVPFKVEPPMANVEKRRLISTIGEAFKDWADTYFCKENEKLNRNVLKEDAFKAFVEETKLKTFNSQRFNSYLKLWCQFYDYEFNPEDAEGYSKHHKCIMKRTGLTGIKAHIYIRTNNEKPNDDNPF